MIKTMSDMGKFVVVKTIFSDGFFQIIQVKSVVTYTAKGYALPVSIGDIVHIYGEMTTHNKFGKQISIQKLEIMKPETKAETATYYKNRLSILPSLAAKLVQVYDDKFFEVMAKDSKDILMHFDNKHCATILEAYNKYIDIEKNGLWIGEVYCYLLSNKFTEKQIDNIISLDMNRQELTDIIYNRPYKLIEHTNFAILDQLGQKIGIASDNSDRIDAGLTCSFSQNMAVSGMKENFLLSATQKVLGIDEELIANRLPNCELIKHVDEHYYLKKYHDAELNIVTKLMALNEQEKKTDAKTFDLPADLTDDQKLAYESAMRSNVCIISGYPGTGKTFLLTKIIQSLKDAIICAFTGRSVSRIKEIDPTVAASTIHRILWENYYNKKKPRNNSVVCDTLIVDEFSMVDSYLFSDLLNCVKCNKLIIIGDPDQLYPIGSGKLLQDFIDSKKFAHIKLTTIKRQDSSDIITCALQANQGQLPIKSLEHFCYMKYDDKQNIYVVVGNLIDSLNTNLDNIRVLIPIREKLDINVNNMNGYLQRRYKISDQYEESFYLGDLVMNLANDMEKNVYNGDCGIITGIGAKLIEVTFRITLDWFQQNRKKDPIKQTYTFKLKQKFADKLAMGKPKSKEISYLSYIEKTENTVCFAEREINNLSLAYASTVHKDQGSEHDYVIFILANNTQINTRRLIYTAMTRAKKKLFLISTPELLASGIKRCDERITLAGKMLLNS